MPEENENMGIEECYTISGLYDKLIASEYQLFPISGKVNTTDKQGVYIIFSPSDDILHVGSTKSGAYGLNQRLYDHLAGTSSFRNEYLKKNKLSLRSGYKYKYLVVECDRKRTLLEALSIGLLCPVHLGTGKKRDI